MNRHAQGIRGQWCLAAFVFAVAASDPRAVRKGVDVRIRRPRAWPGEGIRAVRHEPRIRKAGCESVESVVMLDGLVRPLIDPPLDRAARWLAERRVSADSLTWFGLAIGLATVPTIAAERYLAGLLLILANRLLDGLDGAVARQTAPTDRGAYLDIVGDFLFYSGVVFAFALARPGNATAAAFLILA